MLRKMRENFKSLSWTLWIVIVVFIGGFIIFSGGPIGSSKEFQDTVASVDGMVISKMDFQRDLYRMIENYRVQLKGNFNKSFLKQMNLSGRLLNDKINALILLNEAKKANIKVSDEEVAQRIQKHPAFQENNSFIGREKYLNLLSYQGISATDFEASIREQIKEEKLREILFSGLVLNKDLLFEMYKSRNDNAKLEVSYLDNSKIDRKKINLDESEIQKYYQDNMELFKTKELRDGMIVAMEREKYKGEVTVSDDEKYQYYKANKSNFIIPGKTRLFRIFLKYNDTNREEVFKKAQNVFDKLNHDNFTQIAKDVSEDKKAQNGGDWGYKEWGTLTSQEKGVIDNHKENYISSPIDTQSGFAIIYLKEKVLERQEDFGKAKERITKILHSNKLNQHLKDKLAKISKELKDSKSIEEEAKKRDLKFMKVSNIEMGSVMTGVDPTGSLSNNLFTLQKGKLSEPVSYINGWALIKLNEIKEPQFIPFDKCKAMVKESLIKVKVMEKLKEKANNLYTKLSSVKTQKEINNILQKEKMKFSEEKYTRGDRLSSVDCKGLDKDIFRSEKNSYLRPLILGERVALIKVLDQKISSIGDFNDNYSKFYDEVMAEWKRSIFNNYLKELRDKYKVTYNSQAFKEIEDEAFSRVGR